MSKSQFKKTGLSSIWKAFVYSFDGLTFAWQNEQAFRHEVFIGLLLVPIIYLADIQLGEKLLLSALFIFLLLTELINSAIEALADKICTENDLLIKRAKDMGSAAVFLAILINIIGWIHVIKQFFLN